MDGDRLDGRMQHGWDMGGWMGGFMQRVVRSWTSCERKMDGTWMGRWADVDRLGG